MPITYPSKYPPKYYNPNWSTYDQRRITWEYHYGVGNTTSTPRTSSNLKNKNKEKNNTGKK